MKMQPITRSILAMALCACMPILARAQADNTIVVPDINKQATKVLPITISGFSGETLSVIRFDLEVFPPLGFDNIMVPLLSALSFFFLIGLV